MNLSRLALFPLLAVAACDPNGAGAFGTSVGNPGKESFRMAPPTDDRVSIEGAIGLISGQYLVGCDGSVTSGVLGEDLDLLGGPKYTIPAGDWCAMVLDFDSIQVDLNTGEVQAIVQVVPSSAWTWWMSKPLRVDRTKLVVELGDPGWIELEDLPEGEDVVIGPDDPAGAAFIERLASGGVYEDLDEDGQVSEDERAAGSLAAIDELPASFTDEEDETRVALEGCQNCSTGAGGPASLAVLAAAAAWARVRRRRPRG